MARSFGVPIALPADAASNLHATTKQQMDAAVATRAATSHTHAEGDVTSLTADLALKAPLASPTFTGLVTSVRGVKTPYTHGTTTGTVTIDPTLGDNCYVGALTGNIVLTPSTTGALDGQMLMVQVRGHASSTFTITNTGPTLTTGLTSPFSLAGGKYAFLGYRYSATLGGWVLLAYTASL